MEYHPNHNANPNHFRSWKSGKIWLYAASALISLLGAGTITNFTHHSLTVIVHADTIIQAKANITGAVSGTNLTISALTTNQANGETYDTINFTDSQTGDPITLKAYMNYSQEFAGAISFTDKKTGVTGFGTATIDYKNQSVNIITHRQDAPEGLTYKDQTNISVQDFRYAIGSGILDVSKGYIGGTDATGKTIPFANVQVDTSKVNLNAPGIYPISYSIEDSATEKTQTVVANVTVGYDESQIGLTDTKVQINQGDSFDASKYFVWASDLNGNTIDFNDVKVDTSKLNTAKPGVYPVYYTIPDSVITGGQFVKVLNVTVGTPLTGQAGNFNVNLDMPPVVQGDSNWGLSNGEEEVLGYYGDNVVGVSYVSSKVILTPDSAIDGSNATYDTKSVDVSQVGIYQVPITVIDPIGNSQTFYETVVVKPKGFDDWEDTWNPTVDVELPVGSNYNPSLGINSGMLEYGMFSNHDFIISGTTTNVNTKIAGYYQTVYTITYHNGWNNKTNANDKTYSMNFTSNVRIYDETSPKAMVVSEKGQILASDAVLQIDEAGHFVSIQTGLIDGNHISLTGVSDLGNYNIWDTDGNNIEKGTYTASVDSSGNWKFTLNPKGSLADNEDFSVENSSLNVGATWNIWDNWTNLTTEYKELVPIPTSGWKHPTYGTDTDKMAFVNTALANGEEYAVQAIPSIVDPTTLTEITGTGLGSGAGHTASVYVYGNVDTSKPGTYQVKYCTPTLGAFTVTKGTFNWTQQILSWKAKEATITVLPKTSQNSTMISAPASASLSLGQVYDLTNGLKATDSTGKSIDLSTGVTVTIDGKTISETSYKPTSVGNHTIIYSNGTKTATTILKVIDQTSITAPATYDMTDTQIYDVSTGVVALDTTGKRTSATYSISGRDVNGKVIDSSGFLKGTSFAPTLAGTYIVTASSGDKSAKTTIAVAPTTVNPILDEVTDNTDPSEPISSTDKVLIGTVTVKKVGDTFNAYDDYVVGVATENNQPASSGAQITMAEAIQDLLIQQYPDLASQIKSGYLNSTGVLTNLVGVHIISNNVNMSKVGTYYVNYLIDGGTMTFTTGDPLVALVYDLKNLIVTRTVVVETDTKEDKSLSNSQSNNNMTNGKVIALALKTNSKSVVKPSLKATVKSTSLPTTGDNQNTSLTGLVLGGSFIVFAGLVLEIKRRKL